MSIGSLTYQQSVLSAITVTNVSRVFTYKTAAKISWHRSVTITLHII